MKLGLAAAIAKAVLDAASVSAAERISWYVYFLSHPLTARDHSIIHISLSSYCLGILIIHENLSLWFDLLGHSYRIAYPGPTDHFRVDKRDMCRAIQRLHAEDRRIPSITVNDPKLDCVTLLRDPANFAYMHNIAVLKEYDHPSLDLSKRTAAN